MGSLTVEHNVTWDAKPGGAKTKFSEWSQLFGIDVNTGFLANAPLPRLPSEWEQWEAALEDAMTAKLQLGVLLGLSEQEQIKSEEWRLRVRNVRSHRFTKTSP
jgi:Indoleamine 2,3-dioxygenase